MSEVSKKVAVMAVVVAVVVVVVVVIVVLTAAAVACPSGLAQNMLYLTSHWHCLGSTSARVPNDIILNVL